MSRKLFGLISVAFLLLLAACQPSPQYQEHFTVPKNAWSADFKPECRFTITDTAAAYQLFFLIRHTDAYAFSNIWIMLETQSPGDSVYHKMRVEVPLSASTGQWLGRGMGEIWEQRVAINTAATPAFFGKKGNYVIRMSHDMRKNPLPEIMQVGLRIEKLGIPQR